MWASGGKVSGGIASASQHVYRAGFAGYDFSLGDFTVDSAWHDWDLSGIVPAGTTVVHCRARLYTGASLSLVFQCRKNGETDGNAMSRLFTHPLNQDWDYDFWVNVDGDRVAEYFVQTGGWNNLDIIILDYIKTVP